MKLYEIRRNRIKFPNGSIHHNILISIQGKIFLDWPAEWLADISLGMMEKYPRAINLAKINFGNALFFRDGECWTSSARIGNLLFHEKNNSSKRRRIKGKKKKKREIIVPIFRMEIFIQRVKRKWIEIVFHGSELHLLYLKRTLFGMHSANLDRFANFGPLLLETMDPFQVSKWNYHPQVCYCLKLAKL